MARMSKRDTSKESAARFLAMRAKRAAEVSTPATLPPPAESRATIPPEIAAKIRDFSRTRFYEMEYVDEGDWGWVLYLDARTDRVEPLWYDDDEDVCSCGDDECRKFSTDGGPTEPDHESVWMCICYAKPGDLGRTGYWLIDPEDLRTLNDANPTEAPRSFGSVYVVSLTPELPHSRLKIGFTARPIERRLESFRTANPNAELVVIFKATRDDERRIHNVVPGRVGTSEVFDCSIPVAIAAIERMLGDPVS